MTERGMITMLLWETCSTLLWGTYSMNERGRITRLLWDVRRCVIGQKPSLFHPMCS